MATAERTDREVEDLRRQLAYERAELAADLAALRDGSSPVEVLRSRLPLIAVATFATTFVLSGGVGAAARLLFRRGREGREVTRIGRYVVIDRG